MTRTEETFLDDPVTPAPIFAYRALRGLIFGSPDPNSSPERVLQHDDKENASPRRLVTIAEGTEKANYTSKSSPQKRKRGIETTAVSPSKGLAVPLSPTKGILRTPGVPTPRAKALRDINVKFRSLSPEVRRKEVKHDIVLEDIGAKRQKVQKDDLKVGTSRVPLESAAPHDTPVASVSLSRTKPSTSASSLDFEGYQRRTEKEMKMLIRQGQKWREYARLQDDENAKLRQLLQQAQKENERLERKLRLLERDRGAAPDPKLNTAQLDSGGVARIDDSKPPEHPKPASNSPALFASKSISHSLETRLSQLRQSSAPSLTSQTLPTRPPKPPVAKPPATAQKHAHVAAGNASTKTPAAPSPLTALAQKLEPDPSPHTSLRTNLAPERYSAARQRIRQKQQARKASALSHVAEESNIDWAGLG